MVKQFATFLGAGQIVPAYFSFSARPIYIPRVATFSADPILAQMDPGRAVLRGVTTITYAAIVPALARLGTMPTTVTSPHSASVDNLTKRRAGALVRTFEQTRVFPCHGGPVTILSVVAIKLRSVFEWTQRRLIRGQCSQKPWAIGTCRAKGFRCKAFSVTATFSTAAFDTVSITGNAEFSIDFAWIVRGSKS